MRDFIELTKVECGKLVLLKVEGWLMWMNIDIDYVWMSLERVLTYIVMGDFDYILELIS